MAGLKFFDDNKQEVGDAPDYFYALDSHNYGNGNYAITDTETWGDKIGNAGKLLVTSLASGGASFYNTAVSYGNFFGADLKEVDLAAKLMEYDDDLGKYYEENKETADALGFVVSSFIPGLAGVKLLNSSARILKASETGIIGNSLSKSTGLLSPTIDKYIAAAATDIAQGRNAISLINANTVKALGAGFGQAALESTAFELAVAATLYKSPILENSEIGDIASNILTGTLLGGGIFGAFSSAKIYGSLRKLQNAEDLVERPFTAITPTTGLNTSDSIIQRALDKDALPSVLPGTDSAIKLEGLKEAKLSKLNSLMRLDMQKLASDDADLVNLIADRFVNLPGQKVQEAFLGVDSIGRLSSKLPVDPKLAATKVKGLISVYGDDAGELRFEKPKLSTLADNFKTPKEIDTFVSKQKFRAKESIDLATKMDDLKYVEARYIFANKLTDLPKDLLIKENDIPFLEAAYRLGKENVRILGKDGYEYVVGNTDDLLKVIQLSKEELAYKAVKSLKSTEEAAFLTNTKVSYLENQRSTNVFEDIFAKQADDIKIQKETGKVVDTFYAPKYMQAVYDTSKIQLASKFEMDAIALFESEYKLYKQGVDNVIASAVEPELYNLLPDAPVDLLSRATTEGAGSGLVTSANGNYGSAASFFEGVGKVAAKVIQSFRNRSKEFIESAAVRLSSDPEAAILFQKINDKVASTAEPYVLEYVEKSDSYRLISKKVKEYRDAIAKGEKGLEYPKLAEGADELIDIPNEKTAEFIKAYIEGNGDWVTRETNLRNAQKYTSAKAADEFYPVRANTRDYQHYVFVVDGSVSGAGHVSMIHAASATELKELVSRAQQLPAKYKIIDKDAGELFKKASKEYEYERTLNSNYIDADLNRKGINSNFFLKTNPEKITQDVIESMLNRESVLAREYIFAKYEKEFAQLKQLGDEYSKFENSKYGTIKDKLTSRAPNPYTDYIKTALNVSKGQEYPYLTGLNQLLDSAVSRAYRNIQELTNTAANPAELESVNKALDKLGIDSGYKSAAEYFYANHPAPKGVLSSFVRTAHAVIANLTLNFDPLNAVANMINSNVLLGTETKYLLRQIKGANPEAAGELSKLISLDIPEVNAKLGSAFKLIGNAYKEFFGPNKEALISKYKKAGFISDEAERMHSILDDFTLQGTESAELLEAKKNSGFKKFKDFSKSLAIKGTKYTGNEFAEQLNRFVAANVMEQITDLALKYGVLKNEKEAFAYVNTFVNRTQGNYLAAQRPQIFQGPIGQSIGLFQTYMFNMMQQIFRYAQEGNVKDIGLLLGLQGTFNGLNGLPAFQAINTHIIGTASGNTNNRDLYNLTYGALGETAGNLLVYGLPSNILQTNVYSRGDINPRNLTIVPVNPADIPIVSIFSKTIANSYNTIRQITNGGEVADSLLIALENNGLNRPLAGLAQVARGFGNADSKVYSLTDKGNLSYANDLVSFSNISRLAGGKPLDEAIVRDSVYRYGVYQAYDTANRNELGKAVKTTLLAGDIPTEAQLENFMQEYVAIGGKQKDFNKWIMELMKSSNTSQANAIIKNLSSPYSQTLQTIMGGGEGGENYEEYNLR